MRPVLLSASLLALAGCFIPSFEVDGEATSTSSASSGVGQCESTPFATPAATGTGGSLDLRFALYEIDLGETAVDLAESKTDCSVPRARIGFDLDGRCSGCACTTGEPSCISAATELCDGPRGIDNGVAEVIAPFSQSLPELVGSPRLTQQAQAGNYVLLLRVWEYNGALDDDKVSFAIYGGRPPVTAPPLWNGQDTYPVAGESVASWEVPNAIERPLVRTSDAYVVGGRLIAVLDGDLPFGATGITLPFTSGRVEADLSKEGELWTVRSATVGGRTEVRPFHAATGEIVGLGVPLCRTAEVWGRYLDLTCQNRDLPPGAPGPVSCSAISFGFDFEARAVTFGPVVAPVTPLMQCYQLPVDPCAGK